MNWLNNLLGLKPKTMIGIDVSHNNGSIDWNKVKNDPQGIQFTYVKATQGVDFVDPKFAANVTGAKAAGIKWGAYHFATWNNHNVIQDARLEAANFISKIKTVGVPDMPLVLDAESNEKPALSPEELLTFINTFMSEVTKAGYEIMFYSYPGWINSYLPKNHGLGKYKLWLADYNGPLNPVNGWTTPYMHQYSEKGKVAGIATNVDMNKIL